MSLNVTDEIVVIHLKEMEFFKTGTILHVGKCMGDCCHNTVKIHQRDKKPVLLLIWKQTALSWYRVSLFCCRYNQHSKRYEFSDVIARAYNRHKEFCYRSSYFGALTDLSLPPTLPVITVNPRLSLKPPYMFCQQGKDTLRRVIDTGNGLENRHNARANQHSLVSY